MTAKRKRGRPRGTKDSEVKAIQLWIAVELERCGPRPRRPGPASVLIAERLAERGYNISDKHIEKIHREVERRRKADPVFAQRVTAWLEGHKELAAAMPGGVFIPQGFRRKLYEGALSKFVSQDDPFAEHVRQDRADFMADPFRTARREHDKLVRRNSRK